MPTFTGAAAPTWGRAENYDFYSPGMAAALDSISRINDSLFQGLASYSAANMSTIKASADMAKIAYESYSRIPQEFKTPHIVALQEAVKFTPPLNTFKDMQFPALTMPTVKIPAVSIPAIEMPAISPQTLQGLAGISDMAVREQERIADVVSRTMKNTQLSREHAAEWAEKINALISPETLKSLQKTLEFYQPKDYGAAVNLVATNEEVIESIENFVEEQPEEALNLVAQVSGKQPASLLALSKAQKLMFLNATLIYLFESARSLVAISGEMPAYISIVYYLVVYIFNVLIIEDDGAKGR